MDPTSYSSFLQIPLLLLLRVTFLIAHVHFHALILQQAMDLLISAGMEPPYFPHFPMSTRWGFYITSRTVFPLSIRAKVPATNFSIFFFIVVAVIIVFFCSVIIFWVSCCIIIVIIIAKFFSKQSHSSHIISFGFSCPRFYEHSGEAQTILH